MRKGIISLIFIVLVGCNGSKNEVEVNEVEVDEGSDTELVPETETVPTGEITFPLQVSHTDDTSIIVKGMAYSESGINSLTVNGETAQVKLVDSANKANKNSKTNQNKQYAWSTEIALSFAVNNKINVEIEDTKGNKNSDSIEADVKTIQTPSSFALDSKNNRLIGLAYHEKTFERYITAFDFDTKESRLLVEPGSIEGSDIHSWTYSSTINSIINFELSYEKLTVVALDLVTGYTSNIGIYDMRIDENVWHYPRIEEMVYDSETEQVYVSIRLSSRGPSTNSKSAIYRLELDTQISTLLKEIEQRPGEAFTGSLGLTSNGPVFIHLDPNQENQIIMANLKKGNSSTSDRVFTIPFSFVRDVKSSSDSKYLYLVTKNEVARLDMETEQIDIVSDEKSAGGITWGNVEQVELDESNNRLLIREGSLDLILQIDLETGSRSELLGTGVGTGTRMRQPREIAIDNKNHIVYIADSDNSHPDLIMSIDLTTGSRTKIFEFENNVDEIKDIVIDEAAQILYLVTKNKVYKYRIDSKEMELISSNSTSLGIYVDGYSGAALDSENNRLLVTDRNKSILLAIDILSGKRTLIASEFGPSGEGESGAVDVKIDSKNNKAYVLSQSLGALFSVDLTSGSREIILDSCITTDNKEALTPKDWNLHSMAFDKNTNQLLITADQTVLVYDLGNNTCSALEKNWRFNAWELGVTNKSQLFYSTFNTLHQLDLQSGQSVVISK